MGKGMSQAKKGGTNRQSTLNILNNVADAILKKQLQMRQDNLTMNLPVRYDRQLC